MSRSQSLSTGGKTPENRDLTSILDFGRKLEEKGLFPKMGDSDSEQGAILEEPAREKLESFEDLDAMGLMDHPEQTFSPGASEPLSLPDSAGDPFTANPQEESSHPLTQPFDSAAIVTDEREFLPQATDALPLPSVISPTMAIAGVELAPEQPVTPGFDITTPLETTVSREDFASPVSPFLDAAPPSIAPAETPRAQHLKQAASSHPTSARDSKLEALHEPVIQAPKVATQTLPPRGIQIPEPDSNATAEEALFHLQITGTLSGTDRNRITDFLRRESGLGIRPEDIKLQLETGNVLLPRLSEYVVTLLAQLLRSSQADIRILPADAPLPDPVAAESQLTLNPDSSEAASSLPEDLLPVLSAASGVPTEDEDLGILSSTALLPVDGISGRMTGPSASADYPATVERLKREIQSRARVKKADKITDFKISWEAVSPEEANVLSSVAEARRFRHGAWKITATGHARRARR